MRSQISSMKRGINGAAAYWRLAFKLRSYLKEKVTPEDSWQLIRKRLERRQENLLSLVKRSIYGNENSPYLKLLKLAGCEYGDFAGMVDTDGIENTLHRLCKEGVYLTNEEFKCREDVVRGAQVFHFEESDFNNPYKQGQLVASTGSSRGVGTRAVYDLDYLAETMAGHQLLRFDTYNALGYPLGMWLPILPGAGPVALLAYAKAGIPPLKWFSPVDRKGLKPSLKHRLGTNYIVHAGRLHGNKFPSPQYVAPGEAQKIAQWISEMIKIHGGCCMSAEVSAAVRICRAAGESGLNLTGAVFSVSSEPLTETKKKEIRASGASVHSQYSFMEAGIVGLECANPALPDDNHFMSDCYGLVQRSRFAPHTNIEVNAFLFTTLISSVPKILLNVENGDHGMISTRKCGCKLEQAGLTTHVHDIRSFDKLTADGMSLVTSRIFRIIEQVLPAKFGGDPNMYQILEEEDNKGNSRVSIVISPEVGAINDEHVIQTVLSELSGKDDGRLTAQIWSQADTLRVKRIRPDSAERGKLLPLHIQKEGPE